MSLKRIFAIFCSFFLIIFLVLIVEVVLAVLGPNPPFKNPSRESRTYGISGPPLKYLVMGDSTAAGQGTDYEKGFAVTTAKELSEKYRVTMINSAVSGSKIQDVLRDQVATAKDFKPDVIVLSVGANDTVRLTRLETVSSGITELLDTLVKINCNAKIVVTGSPDMGTVTRFYPPLTWIATERSKNVTNTMKQVIAVKHLTYAPIFEEVGPPFREDPTLLSEDKFHPNDRGYVIWSKVLNRALLTALMTQKTHCNL